MEQGKSETLSALRGRIEVMSATSSWGGSYNAESDAELARRCSRHSASLPHRLKDASADAAFQKIVRWISRADRPEAYHRLRLTQTGFDDDDIDEAIARAKGCGIIDDARYADAFIRVSLGRLKGLYGIKRELEDVGIEAEEIQGWPKAFVEESEIPLDEEGRAYALLERKPPQAKDVRASAYRKLVSHGYDASIAFSVSREWAEKMTGQRQ